MSSKKLSKTVSGRTPKDHLRYLSGILARAVVGEFDQKISLPKVDDEFGEIYVGFKLLLDSIEEKMYELEEVNKVLARNLVEVETTSLHLQREKAVDESIMASMGEGIVVIDSDKTVLVINGQAEELLGLSVKDVYGKNWDSVVGMVDDQGQPLPQSKRPLEAALRDKKKVSGSYYNYVRKDGSVVSLAITATPVIFEKEMIGAVAVLRDVTEEKEIDRAKTEVISFTSHQLRTPLSVMNWYSEKLLSEDYGPLNKKQKEYVKAIYGTTQKTISLVNTFLNVSRIQLGTLPLEKVEVNIVDVIDDVVSEIKPKISQKKLNVRRRVEKDLPSVWVDQKLIRVVFENLFNNAVKYTPEKGRVTYEVTAVVQPKSSSILPGERVVRIKISDTGYGIPKNQQTQIFSKLFRADNIKDKDTEGAGLGLYMVKLILQHSHGDITFSSKINHGSTFYVYLPTNNNKRK